MTVATKKQRREIAYQKHVAYMEEVRLSGLKAQKKDRENREREHRRNWKDKHDSDHSWKNLHPHCPLCQDKKASSKKRKKESK